MDYDTWKLDNGEKYDDNLCLRCEEDTVEPNKDYCDHCIQLIKEQNRDRFLAKVGK